MGVVLTKWLRGQNIVWPVTVSSVCTTIFNMVLNDFMMRRGSGFKGVALTYALTQWFAFLVLCLVIIIRKHYHKNCSLIEKGGSSGNYRLVSTPPISSLPLSLPLPLSHDASNGDIQSQIDDNLSKNQGDIGDVCVSDPEDNWPALSVDVFNDWGEFLRLEISGAASFFIEWGKNVCLHLFICVYVCACVYGYTYITHGYMCITCEEICEMCMWFG